MKVIKRPETPEPNTAYIEKLVDEYKKSKEAMAAFEKRTNDMKKELSELVITHGIADDKGNLWMEVGDLKLKRERRLSRSLDVQGATAWAEENGYWDEVKEVVEHLSEDKLLGLAWNNKDLEEVIQSFYIEKEVWAFKA